MPSDEGLFDRGDSAISDVDSRGDGIDILVIPDAHAQPGVDNERFSLLGRMICDVRPDVVVSIGDLFDLPSLSSYDVGRKSFEGRTYADDIEAGLEAQELLFGEVERYNRRRSNPVKPEWHYCLGNHEQRIGRAIEADRKLEGTISYDDLTNDGEYPWIVHDFLKPVYIGGVALAHYFVSGPMARPISGANVASSLLTKMNHSCVQGHSHLLDYSQKTRVDGKKLNAVACGWYGDFEEEWAGPQVNALWSSGILMLRDVKDGEFDMEWVSIGRVQRRYR